MTRDLTFLAVSIIVVLAGCKSDRCKDLPAQAQIDVKLGEDLAGDVDSSEVKLTINDDKEVSHRFPKAAPSFVFKFGEWDKPPRTLVITVTVFAQDGRVIGTGELATTFSSDACNYFTVAVTPGGALDSGTDVATTDAGSPDGESADAPAPDLPLADSSMDSHIPDATVDLPAPDNTVDLPLPDATVDIILSDAGSLVPGSWVPIPPLGTPMPVTFSMGSPASELCRETHSCCETLHKVTLTHPFEISAYEVTQSEFLSVLGYNPSYFTSCGGTCPVELVNWYEAVAYCNALSTQAGLDQCYTCSGSGASVTCSESSAYSGSKVFVCPGYRLLTDAEWEYAYRAGNASALYPIVGTDGTIIDCDSDPNADPIGWYRYNSTVAYSGCEDLTASGGPGCAGPHPVAQKAPNAWGLYDMAGNVFEWCHDWYLSDLGSAEVTNPWGAASGTTRVLRGGSWSDPAAYGIRAASRAATTPDNQKYRFGVRCGRTLPACGDGVRNGYEQCDAADLGGKTCLTFGFDGGALKCLSTCTFDTTACAYNAIPGSWATIPRGSFIMGSPTSEICRQSDETQHQVQLTHGFEISAYEVTQAEFQALMGYNPSFFASCGGDCPVEQVNWHEAAAYCNALSTAKGLSKCYSCSGSGPSVICQEAVAYSGVNVFNCTGYRLPTEAEWEYASRSGTTTAYYTGEITACTGNDPNADKISWYMHNSAVTYSGCSDLAPDGPSCAGTLPIGLKTPNAWNLFDMVGNVWEWCHDWHQVNLGSLAAKDPIGAGSGTQRVLRGGSWLSPPQSLRAASRYGTGQIPSFYSNYFGFRPCRSLP